MTTRLVRNRADESNSEKPTRKSATETASSEGTQLHMVVANELPEPLAGVARTVKELGPSGHGEGLTVAKVVELCTAIKMPFARLLRRSIRDTRRIGPRRPRPRRRQALARPSRAP
jgi:hypothetical protein